jgi:hypothetical protein
VDAIWRRNYCVFAPDHLGARSAAKHRPKGVCAVCLGARNVHSHAGHEVLRSIFHSSAAEQREASTPDDAGRRHAKRLRPTCRGHVSNLAHDHPGMVSNVNKGCQQCQQGVVRLKDGLQAQRISNLRPYDVTTNSTCCAKALSVQALVLDQYTSTEPTPA